jgi:hypothetical protein
MPSLTQNRGVSARINFDLHSLGGVLAAEFTRSLIQQRLDQVNHQKLVVNFPDNVQNFHSE